MIARMGVLDGEVDMHARAGWVMGDGNAPGEFLGAHQGPFDRWRPASQDTVGLMMITHARAP
eukprot:9100480-Pyramimonas_sp.AAC.1